jgi:CHAD domain-containing protein
MRSEEIHLKIENLLHDEWTGYRKLVDATKRKPSTKNVHCLRIQIHKLSAAIELTRCLKRDSHSRQFINHLILTQKKMSPLRDIQVELAFLKSNPQPNTIFFKEYLKKRESKFVKRIRGYLHEIRLGKQKRLIKAMRQELTTYVPKNTSSHAKIQIKNCVHQAFLRFEQGQKLKLREKVGLHNLRVTAKHLRYLSEAEKTVIGMTDVKLTHIKKVQVILGKTQDDGILITNIDKYLEKTRHHKDRGVKVFRKIIFTQHQKLVKSASKYVGSFA